MRRTAACERAHLRAEREREVPWLCVVYAEASSWIRPGAPRRLGLVSRRDGLDGGSGAKSAAIAPRRSVGRSVDRTDGRTDGRTIPGGESPSECEYNRGDLARARTPRNRGIAALASSAMRQVLLADTSRLCVRPRSRAGT